MDPASLNRALGRYLFGFRAEKRAIPRGDAYWILVRPNGQPVDPLDLGSGHPSESLAWRAVPDYARDPMWSGKVIEAMRDRGFACRMERHPKGIWTVTFQQPVGGEIGSGQHESRTRAVALAALEALGEGRHPGASRLEP